MSSASLIPSMTRRPAIGLAVIEVALFLLSNITAKNSSHPGTVSNIFWVAFLMGVALLIVLGVITLARRTLGRRKQSG